VRVEEVDAREFVLRFDDGTVVSVWAEDPAGHWAYPSVSKRL
jgi:hypothetical protein